MRLGLAQRMGAALAYYTIFALTPGLVILMALAGVLLGPEAAGHRGADVWNLRPGGAPHWRSGQDDYRR